MIEMKTGSPTFPEIPQDEYKKRIEKAQKLMDSKGLDAMLIFDVDNIRYYTGHVKANFAFNYLWRRGLVIPKKGEVVFVVPYIIYKNAEISTWVKEIRPWGGVIKDLGWPMNHEDVFIDIISDLQARTVGIELSDYLKPEVSWTEIEKIKQGLTTVEFVDASDVILEQRQIKTNYEISIIKELLDKVCNATEKSIKALKEGMTEKEFIVMLYKEFLDEGIYDGPLAWRIPLSGPGRYDAYIMGPSDTPLKSGDTLFIDGGPRHKGYFSDIQRNICFGKPSELILKHHKISLEAFETALDVIRPGIKASDVHFAVEKVLKKYGLLMPTFAGHGIGLYTHEPPFLVEDNDTEIKPGMCLAIEVAALDLNYASDFAVMMPEDMIIVTENGYENLSDKLSKDLWIIE